MARWLGDLKRAIDSLNQAVDECQDKKYAILTVTDVLKHILKLLNSLDFCIWQDTTYFQDQIAEIDKLATRMHQITETNEVKRKIELMALLGRTAVRHAQEMSRRMLPIKLRNSTYNAIADSRSGDNIIEESLMHELGSSIEDKTSTGREFTNARDGRMHSIGTCRIPCSFPGESGTYSTVFHVFKNLVTPLIMGRKFLDDTKTLSRFPERLKRILSRSSKFLRVLHMEIPRRMLRCSVDG
jgi:hypothetical protein